jgi:hypothetical protein
MTSNIPAVGSRASVFHGNAVHTSGGLYKNDLLQNKRGRIVSRKRHNQAKTKSAMARFKCIKAKNFTKKSCK